MPEQYVKPLKILRASAGSGKTFRLTVQFLNLLFAGKNKYQKILAVTFTNKATAEMKNRILTVLKQFATADWENAQGYLDGILKLSPNLDRDTIHKKAQLIYRQILHDYSRLTITTIDKFVQQVIRSFTFELGIDADYRVTLNTRQVAQDLSELLHQRLDENPTLLDWIVNYAREQINRGKSWDYRKTLLNTSKQIFEEDFQVFDETLRRQNHKAVFDDTLVQIKKIKKTFESAIKECLTTAQDVFKTHNPTKEFLKGRTNTLLLFHQPIDEILKKITDNKFVTLLSFANNIDKWFTKNGRTPEQNVFYQQLNPEIVLLKATFDEGYEDYCLALSVESNLYYLRLMAEMSRLLKDYRVDNHVLLISDATPLLEGITRGMEDNPSFIWEKTGNRFRHFLFDEFQDTSRHQWKNFRPLVKNALGEAQGRMIEHLIVGDVKQSIYRWRGGDWNILLKEAEKDLGELFVSNSSLQVNYRSDRHIVNSNNFIFSFLSDWLQNQLNTRIQAAEGDKMFKDYWQKQDYDTIIKNAFKDVEQEISSTDKIDKGIFDWKTFKTTNRKKGALNEIKEEIYQEVADRLYRWVVTEKRYRAGQIGILTRKNQESRGLLNFINDDLKRRKHTENLKIISGEALSLKENKAVLLLLQTFRLLNNLSYNPLPDGLICLSLYQNFNPNTRPITANDWMQLGKASLKDLASWLPSEICKHPEGLLELPLPELVDQLILHYHLDEHAEALPYLLAFRDYLNEFIETENGGIQAFLEWWDEQGNLFLPAPEEGDAVRIMTIHKAKGLDFDVVVIPFLNWEFGGTHRDIVWMNTNDTPFEALGTAPFNFKKLLADSSLKNQYYKKELYNYMEAFNILYVAMTRPKHHLFLCIPEQGGELKKTIIAGDALMAALNNYAMIHQGKELRYPENQIFKNSYQPAETETDKHLETYPTTTYLTLQLEQNAKNQLDRLNNDANIRLGIVVHEILSRCHQKEAVKPTLNKLYQDGWFSKSEISIIQETTLKVLSHEGLQRLLSHQGVFLNERDILAKDGQIYRPDKVLLCPDQTIIIDFKFTAKERLQHLEQVKRYESLFAEMNYPNINSWLFYGFQEKLVKVSKM